MINVFLLGLPGTILLINIFNMLFLVLYPAANSLILSCLFFIPYTLFMLVKETVNKKAVNIALRFAICALMVFSILLFIEEYSILICIFVLIFLVRSFYINKAEFEQNSFKGHLLILACCNIFFAMFDDPNKFSAIMRFVSISFFVDLIDMYVCRFFHNRTYFLYSFDCRGSSKKTVFAIIAHSNKLFFAFLAIAAMLCAVPLLYDYPVHSPKPAIVQEVTEPKESDTETKKDAEENVQEVSVEEDEEDKAELVEKIEEVIEPANIYVRVIIVIAAVLVLIILAVILYRDNPKKAFAFRDFDEGIDESEILEDKKRIYRMKLPSTNKAVRIMFYRRVNSHRKAGLQLAKSFTAKKITDKISETENIEQLGKLYHKARYSGEIIDKDELRQLKQKQKDME